MQATWILVADRVRARLFEVGDHNTAIKEIGTFVNPEGRNPKGSRGKRRPPRVMESVGPVRHAIEPHTLPVDKISDRFAHQLCTVLEEGRVKGHFGQLMLAAPPRFLGHLHAAMDTQLRRCVAHEARNDLTRERPEHVLALFKAMQRPD